MKIALVAPPYPLEEAPSPPLGICYVAAACIRAGADVAIFDYIVRRYSPENLARDIERFEPDVLGITAVTMNYKKAAQILVQAKKIKPSLVTLFGGPHVSFDVENTLMDYPATDLVVIGEAEKTLEELVPVLTRKELWPTIPGIAFLRNGNVIRTPPRPFIQDLDTLPMPARHLLPLSRYQALGYPVSIITSRGCPNKCIFCLGRKMVGFKVRHRSVQKVVDEIETILNYGMTFINIADDLFTSSRTRVFEFCEEVKKRKLCFSWSVFARVNTVDVEILEAMKEAGCHAVSFGIESGNSQMLARVRKGITLDQARAAASACKQSGIIAHGSFLAGLPGESRESLNDSKKFSQELNILYGYHFLAPFPGTTIRENVHAYDLEILSNDWDLYDADHAIVRTSNLSARDIERFVNDAVTPIAKNWEEKVQRFHTNRVSADEWLEVAGHFRTRMIFTALSLDLLEIHGTQPGNFDQALGLLTDKIAEASRLEPDFVKEQLSDLIQKNLIRFTPHDGGIRFFWGHNNKIPVL
ncbi:B12-binding domain-containing radical SAM protein [uncultured Desulfobacter sp.]|uniref:B12-binding domain-containing radical SAM protein n=1 Tax=uncultured Desulfobacter sp. TaxID=240139 RepID=UPI002AAAFDD3|nr:radical SAM protein [uncultured Desulfobacter sp.]